MIDRNSCLPPVRNDWIEEHFEVLEPVVKYHADQFACMYPAFRQERSAVANELWMELIRKSAKYQPAKATPQTFARLICKRKTISILRAQQARTRGHGKTQEFDCRIEQNLDEGTKARHRGCASEDQRDLKIDVRETCKRLHPRLRPLAEKLQTMSPSQAAKTLRLTREELAVQLEAIRKRFQRADLDKYHGSDS